MSYTSFKQYCSFVAVLGDVKKIISAGKQGPDRMNHSPSPMGDLPVLLLAAKFGHLPVVKVGRLQWTNNSLKCTNMSVHVLFTAMKPINKFKLLSIILFILYNFL